jgi:hypothetical protein
MTGRSRRDPAVHPTGRPARATLLPTPPPPARRAAAVACVTVGRRKAVRATISKPSIPIVGTASQRSLPRN